MVVHLWLHWALSFSLYASWDLKSSILDRHEKNIQLLYNFTPKLQMPAGYFHPKITSPKSQRDAVVSRIHNELWLYKSIP